MSLAIYRQLSAGSYSIYAEDGVSDSRLPIITTHDGTLGEVVETQLFVRNEDVTEYYEDIQVEAICSTTPSDITGVATGHGIKLFAGDTQPTEAEWEAIDYANQITLSDIGASGTGDISTYRSFWYRVEVPAGAPADNKENIVLRVSYTANSV